MSIVRLLRECAERRGDALAYRFLGEGDESEATFTYGELDRAARRWAALLQYRATERVALLLLSPGLDLVAAWFGCLYAGVVPVLLAPPHPARVAAFLARAAPLARDAAPAFVITDALAGDALRSGGLPPVLRRARWWTNNEASAAEGDAAPAAPAGHDVAFLQYTSGSTSEPRGVVVTHGNAMHNVDAIAATFGRHGNESSVCWLPPYHDMGLVGGILGALRIGAPATLFSPLAFVQRPLRWLSAISRYRAVVSGAPNFAYDLCTRKITDEQLASLDLRSWDCAFCGAEPIQVGTLRAFAARFASCGFNARALMPCYGLAEATLMVTITPRGAGFQSLTVRRSQLGEHVVAVCAAADPDACELVACGTAGDAVAIVDPETSERRNDAEIGEIWVSNGSVARGYWRRPVETTLTFDARLEGESRRWLRTGDLGFSLAGQLYVTGRLKDLLIVDGANHYPQDVERTVQASDARFAHGECAALCVAGEEREAIIIVAALRHSPGQDAEALRRAVRAAVSAAHGIHVSEITFVRTGSIPRTASGKVRRQACRQAWLARTLVTWERT